jgi:predicted RecA/RadA family phage recombinase
MANNYKGTGDLIPVTAPSAVSSGDIVVVNTQLYGVGLADATSGAEVVIQRGGVWEFDKVTGANGSGLPGAIAYWDNTGKAITTSSTSNTKVGVFVKNATSTAVKATVALNPNAL